MPFSLAANVRQPSLGAPRSFSALLRPKYVGKFGAHVPSSSSADGRLADVFYRADP